ncbi:hypothetical protein ISN45_Aa04g026870 [Arabidopsis thaliana x Arabidopsis arenosa]|uniref:Embryo surrounding factor 1 brassicaceae domain-containing protein n=1 Tax=Arabidopsis thaliana x Arabidopsis arenosa TaxID=1240361 RepID=A0A8T2A958_9BRAS|nr:hypothetical protein ISN45_Aa04g026870 [Arabidopsis thaliana x Arabidopsis arenosa]
MKSSHASLVFILLLSLFALHQCVRLQKSNKIDMSVCVHDICGGVFDGGCYCCPKTPALCWADNQFCTTYCHAQS